MRAAPSSLKDISDSTVAVIMGGGAGTRLFPLTKDRSKPAVPMGGKYRLVDVPISNCLNSGLRRVYVLTQFNSTSLHRHIQASYKFDNFTQSFVEILAAQQTPTGGHWYQGTADAVRQNLRQITQQDDEYVVILSGDQLYRMDYRDVLEQHVALGSDITISTIPVNRTAASGLGIMQTHPDRRIFRFVEKPSGAAELDELRIPGELLTELGLCAQDDLYQASMGIYVFNRRVLVECLDNDFVDFGKNVIPMAINRYQVNSYIFQGYWEDVGTIRAYFDATLSMAASNPQFSFFSSRAPVYTHPRFLPASKINAAMVRNSIISDGCIISDATLDRCLVGIRSVIGSGSTIRNSIILGADHYEGDVVRPDSSTPVMGIGRNCVIERCIVDKNARIGDGVVITPEGKPDPLDADGFYVRDGIVVIPKNGVIAHGRWI